MTPEEKKNETVYLVSFGKATEIDLAPAMDTNAYRHSQNQSAVLVFRKEPHDPGRSVLERP